MECKMCGKETGGKRSYCGDRTEKGTCYYKYGLNLSRNYNRKMNKGKRAVICKMCDKPVVEVTGSFQKYHPECAKKAEKIRKMVWLEKSREMKDIAQRQKPQYVPCYRTETIKRVCE